MALTNFTDKVNALTDVNADAKLHTELKKFFADANNRRLMWANSGESLSQDHARKVAVELKTLDEQKQTLLKNGVAEAMKNLTARINGELVSCADILANNWERAKAQNIPELKQAAALVSLHYMLTNDKALLYGAEAQEYAKQFCNDPENISSINKVPVGLPSNPILFDPYKAEDGKFYSYDGTSWAPTIEEIIVKPVEGGTTTPVEGGTTTPVEGGTTTPVEGGTTTPVEGGTTTPVEGGTTTPVEGGNETQSNTPTIDPIPETTPDSKNTTEAMDGVPSVITSGIDRVDDKERKDYLIQYVNKELNQVIATYFAKEGLGNNKDNENKLIIDFLKESFGKFETKEKIISELKEKQKIALEKFNKENPGKSPEEKEKLTKEFVQDQESELNTAEKNYDKIKYETVSTYYTSLVAELKKQADESKKNNNKLIIPESATFDEQGKVTLVYPDQANAGIGRANKKLEGKEKARYLEAITKLSDNTKFLIDNTNPTHKVYTLGLDKVDVELPKEEAVGQKNIDLLTKTEYYSAIQIEHNATNTKLSELNKQYKESLGIIQKITSDIVAENNKLNDVKLKPENKIEAQVNLVNFNQQLLEEELKLLITASLISTLAGETEDYTSRMDGIKANIKKNADQMSAWIGENEEALKQLNNTKITNQIATIKKATTPEYVKSQEYIVDGLKGVITDSKELFVKINKPYQESEKLIKTYEAQKTYWEKELTNLNPSDPRYTTLKNKYEVIIKGVDDKEKPENSIKGLDDKILEEKDKQAVLLKELTDVITKATQEKEAAELVKKEATQELGKANTDEEKATVNEKIVTANSQIAVAERKIALRSTLKNGERLYMVQKESSDELKNIAQSGDRSKLLSEKESGINADIINQTVDNKDMVTKKAEQIQKESTEYSTKLGTLQKDIDTKEQEVKTELEKAANNQEYLLEIVTENQLELLTHYQEKQEFLDKYNDTYYKDQQNYQRDFKNKLIATTAYKEHTKQNVSRLKAQITEVDKDIATKRKLVMDIEAQITELVTTSTTDPTYQEYVNSQIVRLTDLMNATIRELTADETLIDPNNRRKTLEKFMAYDFEFEFTTSKPKEGSLCAVSNKLHELYIYEEKQAEKREQAENFEGSRIDYIGTNAQTAIMKEKLAFYGEYNVMLLDQIADYTKSIARNTEDIDIKKGQLKLIAGDTETEKILNADIARLTSENASLIKLRDDISVRQSKLQTTLDAAKGEYAKMVENNDNAKKVMNMNETTLMNNKTALYTDQSSTPYDAGKLDEERMKYKPYQGSEASSSEVKTEEVDNAMKFTETDMKYINKIVESQKAKGITVPDLLPVFNSFEEAKGKFGILLIDQDGVKSKTIAMFDDKGAAKPYYTKMESGKRLYYDESGKVEDNTTSVGSTGSKE